MTFLIPWFPLFLAGPDAPLLGPDWMMISPSGVPVWYDAALHALQWKDGPELLVPPSDDGIFLADGSFLLLSDRTLFQYGPKGEPRETLPLPGLTPDGLLSVDGENVYTVDYFGNRHPAAALRHGHLERTEEVRLQPPALRVTAGTGKLSVNGVLYAESNNPLAGQVLGNWLVVEERAEEGLHRRAVDLSTHQSFDISVTKRLFAPTRDLAAGTDGSLYWMTPTDAGLQLTKITVRP